ncbi:MAG: hypothetical protein ITG07_04615 [Candidimonas sp.]|nr:hypothetical protein [Candidimonas sp.]
MHPLDNADLHAGLTGLELATDAVDLGDGILITPTHAKFLSPLTLVNTSLRSTEPLKLTPSYWQMSAGETDITSQLIIPRHVAKSFDERFELARFIVLILRLWSDPGIGLHVISSHRFEEVCDLPDDSRLFITPIETKPRHFPLGTIDPTSVQSSLTWIQENWKSAYNLYSSSTEFRLAADSLDAGQFVPNHALTLVSLWAALEAIFSPSTSELKFRVSALIAAYLEPPSAKRLELQKQVASLYNMRSAAAHGKPRHEPEHLLKSFELVRRVLVHMIHDAAVPTKELLERRLFGAA